MKSFICLLLACLSFQAAAASSDWKLVLFMQSSCGYCRTFDPLLKAVAQQTGLSVFALTLDGRGDAAFPQAVPATPAMLADFFPHSPPVTPATFLVHVHTLKTWPLVQGTTDRHTLVQRLDTVLRLAQQAVSS